MTTQTILDALRSAGKPDLSIPQQQRQAVLNNPLLKPYLGEIAAWAEKCRGTAIPAMPYSLFRLYAETGDRAQYENGQRGYFQRRARLAAFGVQAWLHGRKADVDELEDIIWAICDEYTWSLPAHVPREAFDTQLESDAPTVDLFAGETAFALAEICFLLGRRLAPLVQRRVASLLEQRIFRRVLDTDFGWMTATNNWAAVCAGSVGASAIYAVEDEAYLARILARLLPCIEHFLSGFAADGSCLEGIDYWKYGFGFFVFFADLLEQRTAGRICLLDDARVKRIAQFQQRVFFPGGRTVCFSDASSRAMWAPGLTCYLHRRFEQVHLMPFDTCDLRFTDDHTFRWAIILRNLIWMADALPEETPYQTVCLPAAQWYIGHSPMGAGVCAKAGHNDEPHNHNDVGSFQYYLNGQEMLCDLGCGQYTRQYFSAERYGFFVCGSQGHSVPMIDGRTQRKGAQACARDVALDEDGLCMELAAAYGLDALKSLRRAIAFDRRTGAMTLTDDFQLDGESHDVCERFITLGPVALEEGCARIQTGGETLRVFYDAAVFTPAVAPVDYATHLGARQRVFTLDFHARAAGAFNACFRLIPG